MRLSEAVARYLSSRATRVASNTLRADTAALRRLVLVLGDPAVADIDQDDIDDYFLAMDDLAESSRNLRLGKINGFFTYCQARGWVTENPATERRRLREPEGDPLFIPVERFPDVLAGAENPRDRMIVALGMYLFLRSSEIRSLRLLDVKQTQGHILTMQHKTATRDRMPICSELDAELKVYIDWYASQTSVVTEESYLVPRIMTKRSIPVPWPGDGRFRALPEPKIVVFPFAPTGHPHRAVQKALAAAGYPVLRQGGHTLRRSGARALFDVLRETDDVTGALQTVKTMLHHKSTVMTERYLGIQPERERRDALLKGRMMFGLGEAEVVELEAWR